MSDAEKSNWNLSVKCFFLLTFLLKSPVANSVWTWWLLLLSLDVTLYSAQPTEHDHESSCLFLFYTPIHSAYLKLTKKTYNCKLLDWDTELYWENKCNLYWNLSRLKFLVKLKEVSHKITTRKIILQENKYSMLSIYCFMNMIEISLTLINWACDFVVGIHGG